MTLMERPPTSGAVPVPVTVTVGDDATARWVSGHPEALRSAYDAWGAVIHAYCARRLGASDAADATQEVFVSAWRKRAQFDRTRGNLSQWLFGIARNTCTTFQRRGARGPQPVAEVPTVVVTAAEDDRLSDRLLLAGALQRLPERQQQVLRAAFVDGWTNQEVADRLDLPLGTVKSDIRRGLRSLRGELEESR